MKIGFVINPLAGIGGSVGLKGSDGKDIVDLAISRGARPQATARAMLAMQEIKLASVDAEQISFLTASNNMGETVLRALDIPCEVLYKSEGQTTPEDTKQVIALFVENNIDLLVFVGGDGTARDVLDALSLNNEQDSFQIPVIGIPAGVKIHSAVYSVTPLHAGEIINFILQGKPLTLHEAQVMDLDEQAFREGKVIAKCYGYLSVPVDDTRMQLIKQGGIDSDEVTLQDMAADIIETMEQDVYYLIGSGSTTAEIMNQLSLPNTLLGIDIVLNQELIASDVDERSILEIINDHSVRIIVTVIGGQGHVFGRGNQQLSGKIISHVINQSGGQSNIIIIATNEKLRSLDARPMIADTGSNDLDNQLAGLYSVVTGYQQKTLYRLNRA
jgi:predicted polyphosphate/ATP-dependent NAD kinase